MWPSSGGQCRQSLRGSVVPRSLLLEDHPFYLWPSEIPILTTDQDLWSGPPGWHCWCLEVEERLDVIQPEVDLFRQFDVPAQPVHQAELPN